MSNNDENKNLKNEEDILDIPSANRITFYYKNLDGTVEYTPHITKVNTRLYLISRWSNDFTTELSLIESPHDRYMTYAGMNNWTHTTPIRPADIDPNRDVGNHSQFGHNNKRFWLNSESSIINDSSHPGTVLTNTETYTMPQGYEQLHHMEEVNGDGSGNRPVDLTFTMIDGLNRKSIEITHLRFKVTTPLNSNGRGFADKGSAFSAFEIMSYETSDGVVHNMTRQSGQNQNNSSTSGVPFNLDKLVERNRIVWPSGSASRSMEINTSPHYHLSGHIGFFYFDSTLGHRQNNNTYSNDYLQHFGTVSGTGQPRIANMYGYRNWIHYNIYSSYHTSYNNGYIFILHGPNKPYTGSSQYGHNGYSFPVWYAMNFDTVVTSQPKTIDPLEFTGANVGDYYFIDSYDITHHRSDGDFRLVNLFYSNHSDIINNDGPSLYNNKDNIEFITIPSYTGNKIYSVNIDEYEYNSSYTWYELNLRDLDGNSVQDGFLDQNIPITVYAFKTITKPSINTISFDWGNILNISESNNNGIVTVTTTDVENGQNLTITLNGNSYENIVNNNSTIININNLNSINLVDGTSYTITANVTNAPGIAADQATSSPFTIDFSPPVISITGDNPVSIELGSTTTYDDQGATATGHVGSVDTAGTVNLDSVGSNIITYTATDAEGNVGTSTRTVDIVDTIDPIITVVGDNPYTLLNGTTYNDPGAAATDASGPINVETNGSVDIDDSREYILTYTAMDNSGNFTETTRTVNVVDNLPEFSIDSSTYNWDFRIETSSYQIDDLNVYNGGMSSTYDNGALLDGTDDYISLENFELGGDPFTLETYFKVNAPDAPNLYGRIFQFGGSNDNIGRISLYRAVYEDHLALHIRDDQGIISGSSASNLSNNLEINYQWQHFVMVYSGTNLKIYMNGNLVSDITLSRPINRTTRTYHTIGSNGTQELNSMNIKFFRIWDGVALKQYNVDYLFNNKEELVFQYPREIGDVNYDGVIDENDIDFLGGYLVGVTYIKDLAEEDDFFIYYADANENEKVDIGDIVVISNIIESQPEPEPEPESKIFPPIVPTQVPGDENNTTRYYKCSVSNNSYGNGDYEISIDQGDNEYGGSNYNPKCLYDGVDYDNNARLIMKGNILGITFTFPSNIRVTELWAYHSHRAQKWKIIRGDSSGEVIYETQSGEVEETASHQWISFNLNTNTEFSNKLYIELSNPKSGISFYQISEIYFKGYSY